MKEVYSTLISYFKNPVLEKDPNISLNYRFQVFFRLFLLCVIVGILASPLLFLFEEIGWIAMGDHKVEQMFKDMPIYQMLLIGGIFVPIIEELIFRAPITLFKKPKSFKIAFYAFTIIFGFIHITNFTITPIVWLISPLLVIPQLFAGFTLGFIRVKFGLRWSILLHCTYNSFFLLMSSIPEG